MRRTIQYYFLLIMRGYIPLANKWPLGNIPGTGVLEFPATVPPGWSPGEEYPFQALVGSLGNPGAVLTNLMTLTVE